METKVIQGDEFLNAIQGETPALSNRTMGQIFNFYKSFPDNYVYGVNAESTSFSQYIQLSDLATFNEYGIYFSDTLIESEKSLILGVPLSALESESTLSDFVNGYRAEHDFADISAVIIDSMQVFNEDDVEELKAIIRVALPKVSILNSGFMDKQSATSLKIQRAEGIEYFNITPLFTVKPVNTTYLSVNLENVAEACDALWSMRAKRVFFTCEDVSDEEPVVLSPAYRTLLSSIAAYSAINFGMRFDLAESMLSDYYKAASDLVSQRYNYVSDYLRFVSNPIDAGFRMCDHNAYLYLRDYSRQEKNEQLFDVGINVSFVPFNSDRKTFQEADIQSGSLSLKSIKILDLQDVFNLTSDDWDTARQGMLDLNKMISRLESHFNKKKQSLPRALSITDLLLFEFKGRVYLGFVSDVVGQLPYTVVPVDFSIAPFTTVVNVKELCRILDFRLVPDCNQYEKLCCSVLKRDASNMHYRLPKSARGVIFTGLRSVRGVLGPNTYTTISEVGLWFKVTEQLRGDSSKQILSYISSSVARSSNLFTCYGGPHPAIGTDITLNFENRG